MKRLLQSTSRIVIGIGLMSFSLFGQIAKGNLVMDVKPFTSEIELKPKIQEQLQTGGLEWGIENGQLVFTFVNKRFIKFECPWLTRYGTQKSLEVPVGKYKIDCIGLIPKTAFSVEKVLKKGAYFNLNIIEFNILEGKTTTLEVHPVIRKQSTLFVKYFLPEVLVIVLEDGIKKGEMVINTRTEKSIAWPEYTGPLKL